MNWALFTLTYCVPGVGDIRGEEKDRGRFEAMCGRNKGRGADRGRFEAMFG